MANLLSSQEADKSNDQGLFRDMYIIHTSFTCNKLYHVIILNTNNNLRGTWPDGGDKRHNSISETSGMIQRSLVFKRRKCS